jgi:hypothetical protein
MKSGIPSAVLLGALFAAKAMAAEAPASDVSKTIEDAETKLYDLMDKDVNSVSFVKGGFALSDSEQRSLRAVYKSVLMDDSVKTVIIAAWADHQGVQAGEKLSDAQISLAEKRAEAVKKALAGAGAKSFALHNMAKDATWISKTFKTEDAAVKDALKKGSSKNPEANSVARLLEDKGGAGKAVVIVEREHSFRATTR